MTWPTSPAEGSNSGNWAILTSGWSEDGRVPAYRAVPSTVLVQAASPQMSTSDASAARQQLRRGVTVIGT